MSATVPLLFLIGLLGLLSLLQAHHPGETREVDRALVVIASAQGLVMLLLAMTQVFALARP
jgi:hypothetical protein